MIEIDVNLIILARANAGLSLKQLALMASVGENTLSRLENGKVIPRLPTVGKIAKALGKKIEDFRKE